MPVTCTADNLATLAACFVGLSPSQKEAVKIYLLAVQAGVDPDAEELAILAKCLEGLMPTQQAAIQTYLLCQIANASPPVTCENLEGIASPLNSVTPDFIGQVYVQSDGTIWQAGSLLSSSWVVICETSAPADVIWGPAFDTVAMVDFPNTGNSLSPYFSSAFGISVTEFEFNTIVHCTAYFDNSDDTSITELSLPNLVNIGSGGPGGTGLRLNNCSSLTTLNLPSLVTVNGHFRCETCSNLTDVDVVSWIPTNGKTISFDGSALNAGSVNLILARCVAAGVTTCLIALDGGSNAAPTGQGIIDKAALILAGNTVLTN